MTFTEARKNWRKSYKTYREFIYNWNYRSANKMRNGSNIWIFRMVLSSNIELSNVQDFRFVTGSTGGSDWILYKLLLKLSKNDVKALYDSLVKTQKNEKPAKKLVQLQLQFKLLNNNSENTILINPTNRLENSLYDSKDYLLIAPINELENSLYDSKVKRFNKYKAVKKLRRETG